jgi:hypothetical protein
VRRVCRRSWRPVRRSLRWVRRPCRRCIPCVPVASAGAAVVPVASWASASDGCSADDSVRPKAAPSPSSESAFRRDTISVWILSFTCCLPFTHNCRTGMASVERDHLNVGTMKVRLSRRPRVRLALLTLAVECLMTASDSRGSKSRLTNELTLRQAIGPLPSPQCLEPQARRWRSVAPLPPAGSIFRLGASLGWSTLAKGYERDENL